jgi:hypothetical protein
MSSGILQVAPLQSLPWTDPRIVTRFHLREPIDPDFLGRLRRGLGSNPWPEQAYLADGRCGFAPIPVWVNGKQMKQPLDVLFESWGPEDGPQLSPGGQALPRHGEAVLGGIGLRRGHLGTIFWILDGIAYPELQDIALPREVALWLYCDDLKTDVSQLTLVQSPELELQRQRLHDIWTRRLPLFVEEVRDNPRAAQKYRKFTRISLPGALREEVDVTSPRDSPDR